MNSRLRALAFLPLLLACATAASAGNTLAVLTADSGAYLEAFSAFQAAYGSEVPYFNISQETPVLPPGTETVVAFGGKAANYSYPQGVSVVYCMAPGIFVKKPPPVGKAVKISLIPEFEVIFTKLKQIQPELKRLRVFWMTPSFAAFYEPVRTIGERLGIEVTPVKVSSQEEMPTLLRDALGSADAFWLPPDPLLVTPENLMIMREFSWANAIPFYGSTKGMTKEGAAASVGVSFKDMGTAAAGAALQLNEGKVMPGLFFPADVELTLNASAAKKCRLELTPEILRQANYLFP
ncbi:MAG: hypothetical protein A2X35_04940 [Elusimicrobia bacterium GWA2_61_42]|nr:MAG: hypothetical protein A2X35_04940 [Elusimicrobia bacterium GWA2_61_42]OGR77858.1 MAG: hypothetical protein A2X38_00405 [Elusimicrobia bacterium GWC2_61_25]